MTQSGRHLKRCHCCCARLLHYSAFQQGKALLCGQCTSYVQPLAFQLRVILYLSFKKYKLSRSTSPCNHYLTLRLQEAVYWVNKVFYSTQFLPRILTDDHKQQRNTAVFECYNIKGNAILEKIVTDDMLIFYFTSEMKRQFIHRMVSHKFTFKYKIIETGTLTLQTDGHHFLGSSWRYIV